MHTLAPYTYIVVDVQMSESYVSYTQFMHSTHTRTYTHVPTIYGRICLYTISTRLRYVME